MNYESRLNNLRACLTKSRIDCLLVTHLPNILYLTGFTGSAGILLLDEKHSTLYTDGRYTEQAAQQVKQAKVVISKQGAQPAALARARRYRRVGFEASSGFRFFQALGGAVGLRRLRAVDNAVEQFRMVKDEEETGRIRRSIELNSRALEETLPAVRIGVAEQDVAAELEYRMRRLGAERPAFDTIVAGGPRSAMPHARAGARPLGRNELVVLDHGAILASYASDMTRSVCLGAANRRVRELYGVVLEAQQRAIQAVRAGVRCSEVDRAARAHIAGRGFARYFPHSTGHGIGLEVHEMPRVAAREKSRLPVGAVITVEPGVYLPGFGGVRIEDVVLVRETGAEVLTPTPKTLLEIE